MGLTKAVSSLPESLESGIDFPSLYLKDGAGGQGRRAVLESGSLRRCIREASLGLFDQRRASGRWAGKVSGGDHRAWLAIFTHK
ncbi:MAG: hypothetical protein O8C67_06935 [Candidatus Methanoperedens sp.]|nr:hypothetical protein [Candidatus Methanoperedens sp.]MCZ7404652.1 hypothetical protein [Candidatus Methanoperedens sp.]